MNLKTAKILAIINIFLLSFPSHFIYDFFPNTFTSILFPVNESIFEHMKLIVTSTLIYGIFDYIILKLNNIEHNNFLAQLAIKSILSIPIFLTIYLPIRALLGEYLPLTLLLLFITYVIQEIISYYLLTYKPLPLLNILAIPLIIITYSIFTYYTYNPPKNFFFYDTLTKSYGIPK